MLFVICHTRSCGRNAVHEHAEVEAVLDIVFTGNMAANNVRIELSVPNNHESIFNGVENAQKYKDAKSTKAKLRLIRGATIIHLEKKVANKRLEW
jgi:hypothetical protein